MREPDPPPPYQPSTCQAPSSPSREARIGAAAVGTGSAVGGVFLAAGIYETGLAAAAAAAPIATFFGAAVVCPPVAVAGAAVVGAVGIVGGVLGWATALS